MSINVSTANLSDPVHAQNILNLLSEYATDIMGGGEDLSEEVKARLIPELQKRSDALVVIAYEGEIPVGLAISFDGFSTFYARPLLNIHDFVVKKEYRGRGIAKLMLEHIEKIALERGYCKLTLEVLEGNTRAQKIYRDFGFAGYQLDDKMGKALFFDKKLC